MRLSLAQMHEFSRTGFLLIHDALSPCEVSRIKVELPRLLQTEDASRILEEDRRLVRSVYGTHRTNELCDQLTRHPRVLVPAMQLLDSPVYVHQFKINAKVAFGGDKWEWHQDYIFWRNEDGMPADRAINIAIFLDDVTEFNGPMILLPGSHQEGVIEIEARREVEAAGGAVRVGAVPDPTWRSHLSAGLAYALDAGTMKALVSRWGMYAPKASAGAVLMFHPNVVHGSAPNMSPFDRAVVIVTFNSIENVPTPRDHPRPEFLASRDFRALTPVADVWTSEAAD